MTRSPSFWLPEDTLIPSEGMVTTTPFYDKQSRLLVSMETHLQTYIKDLQCMLERDNIMEFDVREKRALQVAAAIIDAGTRISFNRENPGHPSLSREHTHLLNLFAKDSESSEWRLQFANASYVEHLWMSLSDASGMTEKMLMPHLYSQNTIDSFTSAQKYRSRFVKMDKLTPSEDTEAPTYIWIREEFRNFQLRLGMDSTGFSPRQQKELMDTFRLADILREKFLDKVYLSDISTTTLIERMAGEVDLIISEGSGGPMKHAQALDWMCMILQMGETIMKNGPFPLTVLDSNWTAERVSVTYSVMVGRTVQEIIAGAKIYSGTEEELLNEEIAYFNKHGHYREGTSFSYVRGKAFTAMENSIVEEDERNPWIAKEDIFQSPEPGEMIPNPYPMDDGWTVRFNSARPMDDFLR